MTEPLWHLAGVISAVKGICTSESPDTPATGVSIDSRSLNPGDLFVAIKGDRFDGHQFVAKAFAAGASCAIVSRNFDLPDGAGPLILVDDTLEALNDLGRAARARSTAKIIAVTGSVGKTGTKEALRLALSPSGKTHCSDKSYNNQWGVPLSLSRMPQDSQFGIFEVGMNHPREIVPLSGMIKPHIAIITTVAPVHLGFFNSVEEIAEAKAEIFEGLVPGGIAVVNRDIAYFDLLNERARDAGAQVISFGRSAEADVKLVSEKLAADASKVTASLNGTTLTYHIGAPGRHLVTNSLAVLAAASRVGADLESAAKSLTGLKAQKGRGERVIIKNPAGDITIVDESYNANPASVRAALEAVAITPRSLSPRRVAVLGDMLELGDLAHDLHRELAGPVNEAGIDAVYACGPHMAYLFEALPEHRQGGYAEDSEGLKEKLRNDIRPGDIVMIKGSLGSRMGPLVEMLKAHLSGYGEQAENKVEV